LNISKVLEICGEAIFWNSSSFVWALPTEFLPFISFYSSNCDIFSSFCLEGIFDDPKLVADVKEAVATIKKAQYGYEVL